MDFTKIQEIINEMELLSDSPTPPRNYDKLLVLIERRLTFYNLKSTGLEEEPYNNMSLLELLKVFEIEKKQYEEYEKKHKIYWQKHKALNKALCEAIGDKELLGFFCH